jgi:hypothetical protein
MARLRRLAVALNAADMIELAGTRFNSMQQ